MYDCLLFPFIIHSIYFCQPGVLAGRSATSCRVARGPRACVELLNCRFYFPNSNWLMIYDSLCSVPAAACRSRCGQSSFDRRREQSSNGPVRDSAGAPKRAGVYRCGGK